MYEGVKTLFLGLFSLILNTQYLILNTYRAIKSMM